MTDRLYYRDSFTHEFQANVQSCQPAADLWHVILDRTAFYPTSGGQPHDLGTLGGVAVREVVENEGGDVIHVTEHSIPAGPVAGTIDWPRRFDHMQQHTAQHILSAAFIETAKFETVSFHLGREVSTIDLAAPALVPRRLQEAERRANEIIFDDRPVHIRYGTATELQAQGIRKTVARDGILRAIDVENFDRQPCGGTHVGRTGQIGLLLLRKIEKQKQTWRVELVAGYRALAAARFDRELLAQAAERIGCGMPEVPEVVAKILDERRRTQRQIEKQSGQLAGFEAERLHQAALTNAGASAGAPAHAARLVIVHIFDDADATYLRLVASALAKFDGAVALLGSRANGAIVMASSASAGVDVSEVFRQTVPVRGGKGGGSKSQAQGSVPNAAPLDEILTAAARIAAGQK
ncbi:MAG: alanyl-tRNA editing protein [Candidatus Acidiferrales bacterium]